MYTYLHFIVFCSYLYCICRIIKQIIVTFFLNDFLSSTSVFLHVLMLYEASYMLFLCFFRNGPSMHNGQHDFAEA